MSVNEGMAFSDVAGLDAGGAIPARFIDECRAAIDAAEALLAPKGLSLQHVSHLACVVSDADAFAQAQNLIAEALGPARPAFTLRIVHGFARAEQRLALGGIAVF